MHPLAEPWLISESGFQLVLGVWSRGALFPDTVRQARADYGEERPLCNDANRLQVDGDIAFLPIRGPLLRHAAPMQEVSAVRSYASIRKELTLALADPAVKGILLLVDSPGGMAAGVGELADQIRAAATMKPIVAYVDGAACSAAYWLSAGATEIHCAPSALLGSIGTRIALVDTSKLGEKTGMQPIEIISSQSPGKRSQPVDDEVRGRMQQVADDMTDLFLGAVARLRGTTPDAVAKRYGGGGELVGQRALEAGLADRIGTFDSALAALRGRIPSPSGAGTTARTGALMSKTDEQELVTKAELQAVEARCAAAEQKLAQVQPLLEQVAEMTGKATVAEQQGALAQLGARAAMADQLKVGDIRAQLMAKARDKGIPPVAMKGWDKLSLDTLRQVVDATEGLQQRRGGAAAHSEPGVDENGQKQVVLTAEIKAEYRRCGITDEAAMLTAERSRLGLIRIGGADSDTDEDKE